MSSVFHLHRNESLPLSQSATRQASAGPGIRRRLSSLSLNLKIQPSASPAAAWAMRRSKSISAMGEHAGSSVRKWWGWGWGWILARKLAFAADLEMNGGEAKGSWRHVLHKVASQLRRKLLGSDGAGLPQTFRYDSFNYAKNFDGGRSAASLIH
ncbi:hypothetical protein AAHA92_01567 [Salvia divinorum]|uniref:Uncharacterized protein n=1 Tax=Salvia divinorum TaxID=28513 RepID=A0ABD1IDL3_SALDI